MPLATIPKKINYLNNRDILKEIHLSKNSYCVFDNVATDHQFDIILSSVDRINQRTIAEARRNRSDRIRRETGEVVDPKKISITDIVFRVMTWEHIPLAAKKLPKTPPKKKRIEDILELEDSVDIGIDDPVEPMVTDGVHVKLNFPPFFHYRLNEHRIPYIVGKSHWRGDLDHGNFSRDHGAMTRRLAEMFVKLCERYATRSNWRGYCVDQDTQALTQRGWLSYNEINEQDQILSYNGNQLTWSSIKSVFRSQFDGLMHHLTNQRGLDTLITPNHRLVTEQGLKPVELALESDRMILLAPAVSGVDQPVYADRFVELMGWIVTEGCYEFDDQHNIKRITIYQNPGAKADRIRNCLTSLGYKFNESNRNEKNICFGINRADSRKITEVLPEKNLSMSFILNLTQDQRNLLIETMIDGDGWRRPGGHRSYVQKDQNHVDLFVALCTMSGIRTTSKSRTKMGYGALRTFYTLNLLSERKNSVPITSVNFHGGKRNGRGHPGQGKITHPNQPTTHYQGMVWCPETEHGCFVARRNGNVFLTGNTYNEEMKGQALLQLSQIGLQFDESKSSNPFAYFTATITNSFTRILNIEKKNQNIRDDILEMNGLNPSYTRQGMTTGHSSDSYNE